MRPWRVALVGSGPAAFYTLQQWVHAAAPASEIDMFDSLPTPFGLVRHGVAPDHEKIKSVTAVYHKLAQSPGFRFFGNVEYGRDLTLGELQALYHQIVFCTGAQADRALGVPGEGLEGSHSATEFVAWYNGHPDYSHLSFDLSCPAAVVVGVGNVAVDVARILCRTPDELQTTDIADYALEALRESKVRHVHLIGRRGPLQAAFTNPEVKELGELEDACARSVPREIELDEHSRLALAAAPDKAAQRKLEILRSYAGREEPGKSRQLSLRFLLSPVEILGDGRSRVRGVRLVRNTLVPGADGSLSAKPTGEIEELAAGLVFRSVGYRGVALPDLPFDERRAVVPNRAGRILDPRTGDPLVGLYVSGWIKRGPTGVIGTNKPDAAETARAMLEDLAQGRHLQPAEPAAEALPRRLESRGIRYVSYADWMELDALEVARGKPLGRPRLKFTDREALLSQVEL